MRHNQGTGPNHFWLGLTAPGAASHTNPITKILRYTILPTGLTR